MTQDFELNKKRIERLGLTCSLMDNDGKVRYFQDGHEYVEIGGLKWAIKNVGANSITDYGIYFQWGDTQGYTADQVCRGEKCFRWFDYKYGNGVYISKYNLIDGKTVLEASDDAARFHMGGSWRMPTEEDFRILLANTTNEWVTSYQGSGISGWLLSNVDTSKTLFFPACGDCFNGSVFSVGSYGFYWSSSLSSSSVVYGGRFFFDSGGRNIINNYGRCNGLSVRGICD